MMVTCGGAGAGETGAAWWCVAVRPRQSARAAEKLEDAGFEVFEPTHRRTVHRRHVVNGKRLAMPVVMRLPLWPGYMFARPLGAARLSSVTDDSVIGAVCAAGVPLTVPDGVVSRIREAVEAGAFDCVTMGYAGLPVRVGDSVRMPVGRTGGAVDGVVAAVLGADTVEVIVTLLGASRRLRTSRAALASA
eukprot:gene40260-53211_t